MKKLIPLLFVLPLLCSCGKTLFHESHTFTNDTWMRFEPETFNIGINNVDDYYDIVMTVSIDTNIYTSRNFPLVVNMTSDEGETRMVYADIPLFESKSGKRTGKLEGSVQSASGKAWKYLCFNRKGNFKLEVKQGTSKYEISGVKAFAVDVEKAQMVLPE